VVVPMIWGILVVALTIEVVIGFGVLLLARVVRIEGERRRAWQGSEVKERRAREQNLNERLGSAENKLSRHDVRIAEHANQLDGLPARAAP
jgi:hypothetical protein